MWVGASEAVSELDESLISGAWRPEGPANNRPDRKVGISLLLIMSAEGAAL
jgi:hypothetical protein